MRRPSPMPDKERLALSVEEAAALLGISRSFAYGLCARGELPAVRLGGRLVVPRRALERLLDAHGEAGDGKEVAATEAAEVDHDRNP